VKQRYVMRCVQYMNRCISHSTCVLQYPQPEVIPPQRSMLARARACSSFGTVLRQPGSTFVGASLGGCATTLLLSTILAACTCLACHVQPARRRLGLIATAPRCWTGRKKQPASHTMLGAPSGCDADGSGRAASDSRRPARPEPTCAASRALRSEKQLQVGAARWLCSGHRPERAARLGRYDRTLLSSSLCADLPNTARAAG
jgi:hypothetical protein